MIYRGVIAAIALCGLAACDMPNTPKKPKEKPDAAHILDQQAIRAGILSGPDNLNLVGRFETRSELGTDKFCAVETKGKLDIGILAVFGPTAKCEGRGTAQVLDNKVQIILRGKGACNFTADFDGVELRLPGKMEKGCASYCSPRASLSGTHYFMIEQGSEKARRTLGRDFEQLCE